MPLLGKIVNSDNTTMEDNQPDLDYRVELLYKVYPAVHSGLLVEELDPRPNPGRMALDKVPYTGFPRDDDTYRRPQQLFLLAVKSSKTSIFRGEVLHTTKLMVVDLETLQGAFHPMRTNLSLTYDDACSRVRKYVSGQESRIVNDGLESLSGFFSHQDTFELWRKCVRHAGFKFAVPKDLKSPSPSQ